MKILVSACLLGENCKYNGENNLNERLCALLSGHEVVSVCPEVLGGLPVPRACTEIVDGCARTQAGKNMDEAFHRGAEEALRIARDRGCEMAILQSRSPSCGVREIYDGTFSGRKIPGHGIFAQMLLKTDIAVLDVEELEGKEKL